MKRNEKILGDERHQLIVSSIETIGYANNR